ncbi:uncharacterized protein [Nicotiana tomentosiformis]|uniref:uncharacterized protein n=1 Tax=Nicotiana tomentosiformis TaxID=4098 RepID=UPI00388CA402
MSLEPFRISGMIRCPCTKCKCLNFLGSEDVTTHLYRKRFIDNYFVWTSHGEVDGTDGVFHNVVIGESSRSVENSVQHHRYHAMVADAFRMHFSFETHESVEQTPNEEAKYFYEQLEAASRPLSKLVVPTFNKPENFYKAKRLVSKLGLSSMRIDCCKDGCMLYYKGDTDLERCKFCEKPRFKRVSSGKNVAVKSMHYLSIIPRLKRLYTSMSSAHHMRWHYENRRSLGVMCHSSDGEAWKHFDRTYPDYASEPRNVRLGLRTNLMWTINDFPAYGMLSGWMTARKLACPYFMKNGKAFTLRHGQKQSWFDCHRQFLPIDHEFSRMKNAFKKNTVEHDLRPPILSGEEIWERVQNFTKVTEAPPSRFPGYGVTHNWTKQSIFWKLLYWKDNLLRHNLDSMHIEKNYFDNLWPELHLQSTNNGKVFKPKSSYTFTLEQRGQICEWVANLKMPEGYASNLGKHVDMVEGKLTHMKGHDCHIFMETLIPIAFCGFPENIWKPITEISLFFEDLCSTTLREENLSQMNRKIPVISNKLERIFSYGFFDVMEHFPIHLVHDARLGGPVQCRWMYPFESHVPCAIHRPNWYNAVIEIDLLYPPMSIFNQPGRGSKDRTKRGRSSMEYKSASNHVLLNCSDFVSKFGLDAVYSTFEAWLKECVNNSNNGVNQFLKDISWGPAPTVTTMSQYFVNGYKFHAEECSKYKKSNNSGVCVKGGEGNQDGENDYYGVIKEILELSYSGWPNKKIILF